MIRKTVAATLLLLLIGGCGSDDDDNNALVVDPADDSVVGDDSSDDGSTGDDSSSDDSTNDDAGMVSMEGRWSAAYVMPYDSPPVIDVSKRGVFLLTGQEGATDPDNYGFEVDFEAIGRFESGPAVQGTATVLIDPAHDTPDQGEYYETITLSGLLDSVPTSLRLSSQYLYNDVDFDLTVKVDGNSVLRTVDELREDALILEAREYNIDSMTFNDDGFLVIDLVALSGNSEAPYGQNCTVTTSVEPFQAAIGADVSDRHYYDVVQEETTCADMLPLYGFIVWYSTEGRAVLMTNHDDVSY